MLPPERPDRIHVAFDDHRLVANTRLLLPATWDWANWRTAMLTWEVRRVGRMRRTNC